MLDLGQRLLDIDDLTGLYNRRGFADLGEQYLRLARRAARGVALVYLDLDRFKTINDTLGHHVGDRALLKLADLLKASFRRMIYSLPDPYRDAIVLTELLKPGAGFVNIGRSPIVDSICRFASDTCRAASVSESEIVPMTGSSNTLSSLLAVAKLERIRPSR